MTISDASTIDLVATRPGSREVRLIVSDHLDWDDVQSHCLQLQDKIDAYLAFIESGQAARHPQVRGIDAPEFCIAVVGMHEPPPAGAHFLERAAAIVGGAGVLFRFEHRPLHFT